MRLWQWNRLLIRCSLWLLLVLLLVVLALWLLRLRWLMWELCL
jgi:hypothetical protein